MCASLLDREYSLITGVGGGRWVCCLAPVKVVSKEANSLIKLYSQYEPPGTLCNLLFNTPPPSPTGTSLSLPVWLRCQFSWQLNKVETKFFWVLRIKKRKEAQKHREVTKGQKMWLLLGPSLTQRGDERSTSLGHML